MNRTFTLENLPDDDTLGNLPAEDTLGNLDSEDSVDFGLARVQEQFPEEPFLKQTELMAALATYNANNNGTGGMGHLTDDTELDLFDEPSVDPAAQAIIETTAKTYADKRQNELELLRVQVAHMTQLVELVQAIQKEHQDAKANSPKTPNASGASEPIRKKRKRHEPERTGDVVTTNGVVVNIIQRAAERYAEYITQQGDSTNLDTFKKELEQSVKTALEQHCDRQHMEQAATELTQRKVLIEKLKKEIVDLKAQGKKDKELKEKNKKALEDLKKSKDRQTRESRELQATLKEVEKKCKDHQVALSGSFELLTRKSAYYTEKEELYISVCDYVNAIAVMGCTPMPLAGAPTDNKDALEKRVECMSLLLHDWDGYTPKLKETLVTDVMNYFVGKLKKTTNQPGAKQLHQARTEIITKLDLYVEQFYTTLTQNIAQSTAKAKPKAKSKPPPSFGVGCGPLSSTYNWRSKKATTVEDVFYFTLRAFIFPLTVGARAFSQTTISGIFQCKW